MEQKIKHTQQIESKTAQEFCEVIQNFSLGTTNPVPQWIYRGVGDSRYQLIPSALRQDQKSREQFRKLSNITAKIDIDKPEGQILAEAEILRLFYQLADKNGLSLPAVPSEIHTVVSGSINDPALMMKSDILHNSSNWPDERIRPILALAQHYGLPTRLMDWSIDPFVAMYFAAESGIRHLENPPKDPKNNPPATHIGVWQTGANFIRNVGFGRIKQQLDIVHAPRGENPNLSAQKGVFTVFTAADNPQETHMNQLPLNEIVGYQLNNPDKEREPITKILRTQTCGKFLFALYLLPITEAPILLARLHRLGYDAGRIFPGFGGVASAVKNLGRLTKFPESQKPLI